MSGKPLLALSFWRPWSSLIVQGHKDIENRGWVTPYRGVILVHGALTWDPDAAELAGELGVPAARDLREDRMCPAGIVGLVNVVRVCARSSQGDELRCDCGPWAMPGQCHWRLANPRALPEPIPARGRQKLWRPDADVLAALARMGVRLDAA